MKPKKTPRRQRRNRSHQLSKMEKDKQKAEEAFAAHIKKLEEVMAQPAFGALCELMLNNWRIYMLLRTALVEHGGGELNEEAMQHLLQALSHRAAVGFQSEKVVEMTEKFLLPYLKEEAEKKELVLGDLASLLEAEPPQAEERGTGGIIVE